MTPAEVLRAEAEAALQAAREQHINGTEAERDIAFGTLAGVLCNVLERLAPKNDTRRIEC